MRVSSFLPQDKVSEFAHMTPQQLLKETQHAAGDERLGMWHEMLIREGKESKELGEVCRLFYSLRSTLVGLVCLHVIASRGGQETTRCTQGAQLYARA